MKEKQKDFIDSEIDLLRKEVEKLKEENKRLKKRSKRLIDPDDSEYRWKQLGGSW